MSLTKWVVELNEFDIKFASTKAIKGQALVGFVAKLTLGRKGDLEEMWTIHVDGSNSRSASEASMVLTSQTEHKIEHAVHFAFPTTNNVAEYKALLVGTRIADDEGLFFLFS